MLDPMFLAQMMQGMQQTDAMQPQFIQPPNDPAASSGPDMQQLMSMMQGVKAPVAPKPQFSGGVSGSSLPFLQQMPNTLGSAISGASERIYNQAQTPSLGQLIAGGR